MTVDQGERVEGRWPVVVDAEAAYEAIRSINHRTIWLSDGLPAPAVYWVLAELKSALGYGAQQGSSNSGVGSSSHSTTMTSTRTTDAIRPPLFRPRSRL